MSLCRSACEPPVTSVADQVSARVLLKCFQVEGKYLLLKDNNRYYYRNVLTNRIQWEYPDVQSKEKEEPEVVTVSNDASAVKVRTRGSEEHRRSRGSGSGRSKKNEEKEKCKHDRRSSSRHYHRKRRRGRDQSNSSNSSADSQQRRRHRKSKKKKKQHRVERSPSVEIVECIDMVDVDEIEDSPNNRAQPDSPIPAATLHSPPPRVPPDVQDQLDVTPAENPSQPPVETSVTSKMDQEAEAETTGDTAKETAEILNPVVISKPPQIIIPSSSLTGGLNVDGHLPSDHYPDPQVVASAPVALYPPYAAVQPVTDVVMPPTETPTESSEASLETDKGAKKKKKDKKSLATGSSIMMKKKHMSTMVQKWQKVKIEVEKEDLAKELRQAAIRKKIEEL